MRNYLKDNDIRIRSGGDVNAVMRDMMSILLEGALDKELDEELGYSKYDYRNKDTDNSRNGRSSLSKISFTAPLVHRFIIKARNSFSRGRKYT